MGQGGTAVACSLKGTVLGKGSYWETASLTAISMMEVAALICVLEREEVGTEAIGDHQFSSKVPSGHTREHCLIMLQDWSEKVITGKGSALK